MKKILFLHHDAEGIPLNGYDPDIHDEIPEPNIEIIAEKLFEVFSNVNAWRVVDGELVKVEVPPPPPLPYDELRREEYPPIGDQLDAIWKMLAPPAGSEAETMKARIMAVKAKYPKPTP